MKEYNTSVKNSFVDLPTASVSSVNTSKNKTYCVPVSSLFSSYIGLSTLGLTDKICSIMSEYHREAICYNIFMDSMTNKFINPTKYN